MLKRALLLVIACGSSVVLSNPLHSILSLAPAMVGAVPKVENTGWRDSDVDEYHAIQKQIRLAVTEQSAINRVDGSTKQSYIEFLHTPGKKLTFDVTCYERSSEPSVEGIEGKKEGYVVYKAEIVAETTKNDDDVLSTKFSLKSSSGRWKENQTIADRNFSTSDGHNIDVTRSFNPIVSQSGEYYASDVVYAKEKAPLLVDVPYEVYMKSDSAGKDGDRAFHIEMKKKVRRWAKSETGVQEAKYITRTFELFCR